MKNKELIQALHNCVMHCNHCSDACLGEDDVKKMITCIRLDRACAETCQAAANLLSVNATNAAKLVKECEEICNKCADECEKHEAQHCQDCAEACRKCAEACRNYAA